MESLAQYIQTLAPQLSAWRRDFHHFAESGWLEFRTAAKVAEILDQLGYSLAMGRDVVEGTVLLRGTHGLREGPAARHDDEAAAAGRERVEPRT